MVRYFIHTVCTESEASRSFLQYVLKSELSRSSIQYVIFVAFTYAYNVWKHTVLQTHAFNLSILTIYISCAAKNQRIELVFICIPAKKRYRRYRAVPGYILIRFMCPPFSPNYFLLLFFVVFVIFNFYFFYFFLFNFT